MRSRRRGRAGIGLGLLGVVAMIASGCARVVVESEGRADARFEDYRRFVVLPVGVPGNAIEAGGDLAKRLEEGAAERLEARGYEVGTPADAELAIQLVAEQETSLRRTWSSDPDANDYVLREFEEAVLTLRAVDRARDAEIWRGEARSRLRDANLLFSGGASGTWTKMLDELLEAVPAR